MFSKAAVTAAFCIGVVGKEFKQDNPACHQKKEKIVLQLSSPWRAD